jgi:tetratricopeptide (TPR) repeat protein
LVQEEEFDRAIALAKEVLAVGPEDALVEARAHLVVAGAKGFKASKSWVGGKLALVLSARRHLRRAETLAPDYPLLLLGYSTYRIMVPGFLGGDVHRAERDLRACIEEAPNLANAHARLAQANLKQQDLEESERAVSRALAIDPGNPVALEVQKDLESHIAQSGS